MSTTSTTNIDIDDLDQINKILWGHGKLEYKLHDAQLKIYKKLDELNTEEALFLCSRQFGKTYLCSLLALEDIIRNKNVTIAVIAPNQKQASEIIVPKLLEIMGDMPKGLVKQLKAANKFVCARNNSQLIVCGFDTAYEQIRGKTLHRVILEESASFNIETYEYRMKSVIKPTLTHSKADVKMIHATTLAPIAHHPVNTDVLQRTTASESFFKYTIHDNPLLTPERIDEIIEDYGGEDSPDFKREYLCIFLEDASLKIFPSFTEVNVKTGLEVQDHYKHQLVIDLGGSNDKTGILLSRYNYHTEVFEFIDEAFLGNNTTTEEIMSECFELLNRNGLDTIDVEWYADAPGQWLCDVRAHYCINIQLPAKQDKDSAIRALDLAFKKEEACINDKCEWLIKTLKEGTYNARKTDFVRTSQLGHCDMVAAAYYAYRSMNKHWRPNIFTGSPLKHNPDGTTTYHGKIAQEKQRNLDNLTQLARALGRSKK